MYFKYKITCIRVTYNYLQRLFAKGSDGMRYSLISRDWIADSVEIMHAGYAAVSKEITKIAIEVAELGSDSKSLLKIIVYNLVL